jgi:hypothetical protein
MRSQNQPGELPETMQISQGSKTNAGGRTSTNPPNFKHAASVHKELQGGKEAMTTENLKARRRFAVVAIVIAAIGITLPMGKSFAGPVDNQKAAGFAEQVVQVHTQR